MMTYQEYRDAHLPGLLNGLLGHATYKTYCHQQRTLQQPTIYQASYEALRVANTWKNR